MEKIEYGGVTLEVIVTKQFHRSSVRDEVNNFLYIRHEVEAICNFHPALTSYELRDPLPANPIAMLGKLPGETDLAILARLLKPRQLLKVTAGGRVVLETPAINAASGGRYSVDCKNGPTCEFVSVPQMVGLRHWIVHVRFVAHTNDCTATSSIVLSNVWTSVLDLDELYNPTRLVAGKAILRTDMMRAQHITADNFRPDFYFPCDVNYVRENVHVQLSEDGATLLWSFTDVGRCYNVAPNSPIRKIDVFRTTYSKAGTGILAARQTANELALSVIESSASRNAQTILGTALSAGTSVFRVAQNNMPQHNLNIRTDIWGERSARMSDITRISLGICLNQGIASQVPFTISTAEVICRQELTARFVSSEITFRWFDQYKSVALLSDVAVPPSINGNNGQGGVILLNSLFLNYSVINGRTIPGNAQTEILFQRDGLNPAPTSNCRSGLIEKLVVQALLSPCQPVPKARDLTLNS